MENVLIIKKSTSIVTVKKLDSIIPSKKLLVQEISVPISYDSIIVVLVPIEEITI